MERVRVTRADGELGTIDESELAAAQASGFSVVDDAQATEIKARREAQSTAGTVQGLAEAGARGVTMGLSDTALRAVGVDTEGLARRKEGLGDLGTATEVAGAIAPALLSGGTGAVGTLARLTPAGRTAAIGRGIAGATEATLGRGVVSRVVGGTAAGAFEGMVGGAGAAASEASLGDRDLAAEQLLAGAQRGAGLGALFGAGTTTLGIGLEGAYAGSSRVSRGLVEKALGAGDDATSAAGRMSAAGDSLIEKAAQRQVQLLGGTADDMAAASRHLRRTATTEGRTLLELAERGGAGLDDAVGARLRSSYGRASARGHLDEWSRGLDHGAGGKAVQRQAAAGYQALKGAQTPGARALRTALRAESSRVPNFEAYGAARGRVSSILDDMRAKGDEALPEAEAAARSFLEVDPVVWGRGAAAAKPLELARAAEAQATAGLPTKVRKALEGGDALDEATAKAIAREPEALAKILDARAAQADALEGVGQDVAEMRRGIDEMREHLQYRAKVAAAADDAGRLRALEDGPGATARTGLEVGGRALGTVLGGLSFGGAALGELAGKVAGAATRPASMIRTLARARGGLEAVRARHGAAIEAFAQLADRSTATARRGVGIAARRVPVATARQQQRSRRTEALDTLRRVQQLASDPDRVAEEIGPAVAALRVAAPGVAGRVISGSARAAAYLAAIAPPVTRPTFGPDVEMVDPFALDAWMRKADAVSDPSAALDKLGAGRLSKDEAEAIRAVYPRIWADVQDQILSLVGERSKAGKPVSFEARTQLGLLGEVVTDDSLRPADYAAIQASMVPAPPHPPAAVSPRSSIKPTAPSLPKWQALESKG